VTKAREETSEQGAGQPHLGAGQPQHWAMWAPPCCARSWFDYVLNYAIFLIKFLFRDCDVPAPHLFFWILFCAICEDKHIPKQI